MWDSVIVLYVHSSFVIILMGKRELFDLLCLSSWCLVIVVWLFLTMPRVCLQFASVVFPDHTHLLFWMLGLFYFCFLDNKVATFKLPSPLESFILVVDLNFIPCRF